MPVRFRKTYRHSFIFLSAHAQPCSHPLPDGIRPHDSETPPISERFPFCDRRRPFRRIRFQARQEPSIPDNALSVKRAILLLRCTSFPPASRPVPPLRLVLSDLPSRDARIRSFYRDMRKELRPGIFHIHLTHRTLIREKVCRSSKRAPIFLSLRTPAVYVNI